ncbi:bifunctional glutamine-synthetase adenylyltransferase/deadenyltransferase [Labrys okinawensis]|uniref:Bifunctional glutamine synthetase adenylyltransferase/adenylyl-removing enzyme n=1 Tax=Labrys okinawensis TaxID=346911 RepID=A0A2S9QFL8_9HYPH|nr:bifunctional [glutamine synthetase] adenylyltransferase/[glutamine synthetase]-adenylyl-L-tyrosine phosphorylase [Labrys okinawensis]PRH88090.1 bifunctional glutamine-synthetase adenylyltransferase/deadenyltransferase [Labrys okinawensis]
MIPIEDKRRVKARFADLAQALDPGAQPAVATAMEGGAGHAVLAGLATASPFLWGLALADPARLERILAGTPAAVLEEAIARARAQCSAAADMAEAMRALRLLKQEAALLIGIADLGCVWRLAEVTAALTRVADESATLALRFLLREATAAGRFLPPDPENPDRDCGLVALAMGKQGAFELNYSSDIDLIVLYDPETAPLREGLEPAPFFVRLTQGLVKLLSERTADGYVFRVDLRLRPDPGATAIAISLPAAYGYYESVGQNWERAAMIKARPCAGDIALGERFLAGLVPFIWRRHLDYAAIADVHAMKRQIHAHKGHEAIAVAGHNLKLGRGGIREIEFFVQTQQLIAGGRNPDLRGRGTVAMLAALQEARWITPEARDELTEAYDFLRGLEHRLQMMADEQTHSLPAEKQALVEFARFAGYADVEALSKALIARLETVQRHYARLFEASAPLASDVGSLVFTGKENDPETLKTLERLGYASPSQVAEMIRGWHHGRYPAMRSAKAREDLTELTPALLQALAKEGRPDKALFVFDGLLARMPSGYQLFSILRNNAKLFSVLARVLGVAPRLAEVLVRRPHALDGLLDHGAEGDDAQAWIDSRLASALATGESYEDKLDLVRIFVRERIFVLGARLLSGELDPLLVGEQITALAQAVVRALLELVIAELKQAHGSPPGARVGVLAMGKFGGRELTSSSDLDLIVLYDHDSDAIETDGPRAIAPSVWFARLTQRLIAALSAPTGEGTAFSVDMRLRPSGQKGPVAIHIDGFREYQLKEAWTWEHMAMTRARIVAGDAEFGRLIEETIAGILAVEREPRKILTDVAEMRGLLESEKGGRGPWDLKNAPGGLVDIEFIAQTLQLLHAAEHPGMLDVNTGRALDKALEAGVLTKTAHRRLLEAWRLYTALSQVIRFCVGGTLDPDKTSESGKILLSRVADCSDFDELNAVIGVTQTQVRNVFRQIVGGT